jgi:hypothetical protein
MKFKLSLAQLFGRTEKASATGVLAGTARQYPSSSPSQRKDHLYPASTWRAIAREIRSCYRRIEELLRTKLHRRGVPFDPGNRIASTRKESQQVQDACMRDTESLFLQFPYMTLFDARRSVDTGSRVGSPQSPQ